MPYRARYIFNSVSPSCSVELLNFSELTHEETQSWKILARRALTPNPFVEAEFLQPLINELNIANVKVLVVLDNDRQWQFATPVVTHFFEQGIPLPKLRALRSDYTFLNQPLVSKYDPAYILATFFGTLADQRHWHGLGFAKSVLNSEQSQLLNFSAELCGVELSLIEQFERPCVTPQSQEELLSKCSASRRKTLRKAWNRLEKEGSVEFRLRHHHAEISDAIAEFLRLEASGWKGEEGTAIEADLRHAKFFDQMCHNFAEEQRLYFGELLLNGRVIASTCNLLAKETLFAFKIGWDQAYAQYSLGYWSEILLADAIAREVNSIHLIDSCSDVDSYTGKVWPERVTVGNSVFIWSRRAKIVREAKRTVKSLMRD